MELGLFVLRFVIGAFFIGHGSQKLWGAFGGAGVEGTTGFMESLGLKPGRTLAISAGLAEFLGGCLLVLGLVTPLAAAMIIAVMTTAIITVHLKNGPWITDSGWEYCAVIMAGCFALAGVGAGQVSLDYALGWDVAGTGWALAALAAGVIGGLLAVGAGQAAAREQETTAILQEPVARSERFRRDGAGDRDRVITTR